MENKYCDINDIESYTLQDISSGFETTVEGWISSVSRIMDRLANRTLVAPIVGSGEDYEERYYDGDNTNKLLIDDAMEITEVSVGDEWGENAEVVSPTNYIKRAKTAPHTQIIYKNDYFPMGVQNVTVKGRFGLMNEVSDDLRFACVVIVAGIINNQNKGNQVKKSESIGNYSVSYDDDKGINDYVRALEIIDTYRKITF